jgi:hypothetical protein
MLKIISRLTLARLPKRPLRLFSETPEEPQPIFPDTRNEFEYLMENSKLPKSKPTDEALNNKYKGWVGGFRMRHRQAEMHIRKRKEFAAYKKKKMAAENKDPSSKFDDTKETPETHTWTLARKMYANLAWDEKLGLPYGMGFDDYIEKLKENMDKASESDTMLDDLKNLVQRLDFMREKDLVHYHKYIIANKRKSQFQEKARLIILDTIILEILTARRKNWKKSYTLDRMLKHNLLKDNLTSSEYVLSEMNDMNPQALREKLLSNFVRTDDVDKVGAYLATQDIDEKIANDENDRVSKINWEMENVNTHAVEKSDPFFSSFSSEEREDGRRAREALYPGERHMRFSMRDSYIDSESFKDRILLKDIKNRYYRNKFKMFGLDRNYNGNTFEFDGGVKVNDPENAGQTEDLKEMVSSFENN